MPVGQHAPALRTLCILATGSLWWGLPHCGGGHPRQAYFPGAISLKTRLNLARFYFSFCSTCKVYLLCTYVSILFGCNEFF